MLLTQLKKTLLILEKTCSYYKGFMFGVFSLLKWGYQAPAEETGREFVVRESIVSLDPPYEVFVVVGGALTHREVIGVVCLVLDPGQFRSAWGEGIRIIHYNYTNESELIRRE
jgi:hypothetical protein